MPEELKIDYQAAIEHCYKTLRHAQGTGGCIAFAKGAEWMRDQVELNRRAQPEPAAPSALECAGVKPVRPINSATLIEPAAQTLLDKLDYAMSPEGVRKTWESPMSGFQGSKRPAEKSMPERMRTVLEIVREERDSAPSVAMNDRGKASDAPLDDAMKRALMKSVKFIDPAPSVAPEPPKPVADSFYFIKRTNEEYRAWCRTYYSPDALESNGMVSLHGLWAWQEQERRKEAMQSAPSVAPEPPNPWKDAVIDGLVISWVLKDGHDTNPRQALADLIGASVMQALDPAISKQARDLVESGRAHPPREASVAPEPVAHCWSVSVDGRFLFHSADLHDARLRLDGDFEWDDDRLAFAKEVIAKLNAANPPRAPLLERKGVLIVSDQDLRCVIADLTSECKTLRAAASEALQAMEMHANQYPHMQKGYTVDAIAMLRQVLDKGAD